MNEMDKTERLEKELRAFIELKGLTQEVPNHSRSGHQKGCYFINRYRISGADVFRVDYADDERGVISAFKIFQ